jgi:hypothetical protein
MNPSEEVLAIIGGLFSLPDSEIKAVLLKERERRLLAEYLVEILVDQDARELHAIRLESSGVPWQPFGECREPFLESVLEARFDQLSDGTLMRALLDPNCLEFLAGLLLESAEMLPDLWITALGQHTYDREPRRRPAAVASEPEDLYAAAHLGIVAADAEIRASPPVRARGPRRLALKEVLSETFTVRRAAPHEDSVSFDVEWQAASGYLRVGVRMSAGATPPATVEVRWRTGDGRDLIAANAGTPAEFPLSLLGPGAHPPRRGELLEIELRDDASAATPQTAARVRFGESEGLRRAPSR